MPQTSHDPTARWTAHMQDVLASDAGIRDGLHDEEAIPFMAWGRAQAATLAAQMVAAPADVDAESAGAKAHALAKLMTTMSRAVVYRHKQGADWLAKVFQRLNQVSQQVYGEDAPTMSDQAIDAWIASHSDRSDGELLRDLMARYTPHQSGAPAQPDQPEQPEQDNTAPLSDAIDLPYGGPPLLPGRESGTGRRTRGESPAAHGNRSRADSPSPQTGDDHEQA